MYPETFFGVVANERMCGSSLSMQQLTHTIAAFGKCSDSLYDGFPFEIHFTYPNILSVTAYCHRNYYVFNILKCYTIYHLYPPPIKIPIQLNIIFFSSSLSAGVRQRDIYVHQTLYEQLPPNIVIIIINASIAIHASFKIAGTTTKIVPMR